MLSLMMCVRDLSLILTKQQTFQTKILLGKGPDVFTRLVTKGEWNNQIQKIGSAGYAVWILKNGMIQAIKAQNVEEAVQICLREN